MWNESGPTTVQGVEATMNHSHDEICEWCDDDAEKLHAGLCGPCSREADPEADQDFSGDSE